LAGARRVLVARFVFATRFILTVARFTRRAARFGFATFFLGLAAALPETVKLAAISAGGFGIFGKARSDRLVSKAAASKGP
jgi:hypothetical protein